MPDVPPEAFPVHVTVIGSKRDERDALVQAVLDALSEADLREAADAVRWTHSQGDVGDCDCVGRSARLCRAADALHALEAEQTNL